MQKSCVLKKSRVTQRKSDWQESKESGRVKSSVQTVVHFAGRIKDISALILFIQLVRCLNK